MNSDIISPYEREFVMTLEMLKCFVSFTEKNDTSLSQILLMWEHGKLLHEYNMFLYMVCIYMVYMVYIWYIYLHGIYGIQLLLVN